MNSIPLPSLFIFRSSEGEERWGGEETAGAQIEIKKPPSLHIQPFGRPGFGVGSKVLADVLVPSCSPPCGEARA